MRVRSSVEGVDIDKLVEVSPLRGEIVVVVSVGGKGGGSTASGAIGALGVVILIDSAPIVYLVYYRGVKKITPEVCIKGIFR